MGIIGLGAIGAVSKNKDVKSFIPTVGTIDNFILKELLIKNPKVKQLLGNKEKSFMEKSNVVVITNQSKPFNSILTDGKNEFEINLKSGKIVKQLTGARKAIVNHFR